MRDLSRRRDVFAPTLTLCAFLFVSVALLLSMPPRTQAAHLATNYHPGTIFVAEESYRGNTVSSKIFALRGATFSTLTRARPFSHGPLIPSPDGKRIAFVAYPITCCAPSNSGVWTFDRDGTHEHQVVGIPRSPCGNPVAIGSVAWAQGGQRLAYSVFINSDALRACPPGIHDVTGAWVTPYAHPHPRQLTFDGSSPGADSLSWSTDGQTLAVSGQGAVRVVDVATGTTRFTIPGGRQAMFAPRTGTLAYITGGLRAGQKAVLWAVGSRGSHRHVLATLRQAMPPYESSLLGWSRDGRSVFFLTDTGRSTHPGEWIPGVRTLWLAGAISHRPRALVVDPKGGLSSPVWSPDGKSLAYIGFCGCRNAATSRSRSTVWQVNTATGAPQLLLSATPRVVGSTTPQFSSIAWVSR